MSESKDFVKPNCKLIGGDGNVFSLMAKASRSLESIGQESRAKEMVERIWSSAQDYSESLSIIGEYVNIR